MKTSRETKKQANFLKSMQESHLRIYVNKSLGLSEKQKSLLVKFAKYCDRALHLLEPYEIYLVSSRKKYGIKTTAAFIEESREIWIYSEERKIVDIMRSMSHELVHAKQHENNRLYEPDYLHFNSRNEDEANYMSGAILNAFAEVVGEIVYEL